jgi:hypothetical protein
MSKILLGIVLVVAFVGCGGSEDTGQSSAAEAVACHVGDAGYKPGESWTIPDCAKLTATCTCQGDGGVLCEGPAIWCLDDAGSDAASH